MILIGIDPGLSGAIAALNERGNVLLLEDLPTMASGGKGAKVKRGIDPAGLNNLLSTLKEDDITAALERTTAMPGQGVSSMFSMGDTFGAIRAVLACRAIRTELTAPASWKRSMGLDSDKERCRARAIQLFPDQASKLSRKADHNRAEALLLAEWLIQRKGERPVVWHQIT